VFASHGLEVLSFAGLEFAACPLLLSDGIVFGVRMVVARLVSSCACFIVCCIVLRAGFVVFVAFWK